MQTERTVRPDSQGRIALGNYAKDVSSFRITRLNNGQLVLDPYVEIPVPERWLWDNAEAMASFDRGVSQIEQGKTVSRGSFARYIGLDLDAEEDA